MLGVALRKESVDRNNAKPGPIWHKAKRSLSARRAWIEIQVYKRSANVIGGRSPQGERG